MLLVHDGQILARGEATEPFDAFEYNLPQYYEADDHCVVENKYGKTIQTYDDDSHIDRTKLHPGHRPVDLSYLQFVEALYCYDPDAEDLVQQEMTAAWDVNQASTRNERSHEEAFETFFVERDTDDPILERECRPFVKEWISQLSTHDHPGNNIYGSYRKDYFPRKRIATEFGMEPSYPGVSFRYPRGLVSLDLPGLDTKPAFPNAWNVAPEEVLQEPLIYGLDDRSDVDMGSEDESESED
ncbi:hypothetical protein DJ69_15235 [Halorubrum persicum]|uniref:Uncharacterized protein n=1 Tax=Halorubrum persicum TaxID=1383844 RepID=A0A2G1WFJ8_9EURY|nr:hypothetical protein [Halorubrum persicum]PHQ37778.1 hypothetical protein DJ69_15235 [Halorubrum persicum]